LQADFLIIGSGIAALRAAAALDGAGDVLVLTKAAPQPAIPVTRREASRWRSARGHADAHFADTIAAGDGLCDESAVRVLVEEGPRYVRELMEWGAAFDRDAGGNLELGLEARTAAGACCTRATRPAARSAGRWGNASRDAGTCGARSRVRAVVDRRERPLRGVRFTEDGRGRRGAGAGDAAGDRRRGAGLQRDHESSGRDG
jgi:hypothetical protein